MTPIISGLHALSAISAASADFLIASVWQGLLVAGCVAVLLRLLPELTAAVRSMVWATVLLLVMIVPALSMEHRGGAAAAAGHAGLVHASDLWCFALFAVWIALSLRRLAQLAGSALRLHGIARRAVRVSPGEAVDALLGSGKRRVELCVSVEIDRPSVAGFFRPRILLSPELLTGLSQPELEQVVLHEMEHLRRFDDWTNLLQKLSLALVPLHPVLLWLDRQMCVERERACDDSVLRHTRGRKAYAACLARLAEHSIVRRGFSLALGALGNRERKSELEGRVERILHASREPISRRKLWTAATALLATAFAGAAVLARSPQLVSFTAAASHRASLQAATAPRLEPASFESPAIERASLNSPSLRAASFHSTFRSHSSSPLGSAGLEATSFHRINRLSDRSETLASSATSQAGAPHMTLVKAVMPERSVAQAPPTTGRASRSNHLRVRTERVALRQPVHRPSPRLTVVAWQPAVQPAAVPTRLTLTIEQNPQILYAAVPFNNGWLIIQL